MYRQGDVLIERVNIFDDAIAVDDRLLVRGEGRNHGHYALGDEVEVRKAKEGTVAPGGGIVTHFLDVRESCTIEHLYIDSSSWTKEHAPIVIPPGRYRVIRQREYNPYSRAIRVVKD